MMHQLLLDNGLYGTLGKDHIPLLQTVGERQMKGEKDPPFDYAQDIEDAFQSLIAAIRKHEQIIVLYEF